MPTPRTRPLADLVTQGPTTPSQAGHELFRLIEATVGVAVPWDASANRPVALWERLDDVVTRLARLEEAAFVRAQAHDASTIGGRSFIVDGVTYSDHLDQRRLLAEATRLLRRITEVTDLGPDLGSSAIALVSRITAHLDPL